MTIGLLTPVDLRTRDAVLSQLAWDSQVDASAIGVTVKDGTVTLTGFIDTHVGKLAAERAAKRIRGVRAVANDVQVRPRLERADPEIAADAAAALRLCATLPDDLQVVVQGGHLTLTGAVDTLVQRAAADRAVSPIKGVKGIVNRVKVIPTASVPDVQRQIVRALHRDAAVNARGIEVTVVGHEVTLSGAVASWHECESAERAAMHAAGVTSVDNRIRVTSPTGETMADDEDEIVVNTKHRQD